MNYFICLSIITFSFSSFANCTQQNESNSLWVKEYQCDNKTVSIGYELFNESLVVKEGTSTKQMYLYEEKDEVNKEFLKIQHEINQ
jgi:hypothetical protein